MASTLLNGSGSPPAPEPDRRRHAWRYLLAGAALAALVGGAADVAAGRHHGARHAAPAGVATPPATMPVTAPASPSPGPPVASLAVPTATPAGVTWSIYAGLLVPHSAAAGPSHVDGALASGFAHSPLGALLAAANTAARYTAAPAGQWQPETVAMTLPGPGRDRFFQLRPTMSDAPPAGGYAQYAGFRFVTYDAATAVVQVASQLGQALQVSTLTVRWVGDDWRLYLYPSGGPTPIPTALQSLAGFVPWGVTG